MPITKNIVTDYGAPTDGVSDAASAFLNFRTFGRTQSDQIILTVPAHTYQFISSTGADQFIFDGIDDLIVEGSGATFSDNSGTGAGINLGANSAIAHDNTHHGLVQTVAAGATSVTLLDPTKASLLSVGDWALITGFDTQGSWNAPGGYPPNPHWSDWILISAVDSVAGIITFATTPLQYSYRSDWPLFNSGSAGESFPGGPATIYAINQTWNCAHDYRGLTLVRSAQMSASGRSIILRNCTDSTSGIFPTQTKTWEAFNSTLGGSGGMEMDKIISSVLLDACTVSQIDIQSSAPDLLTLSGTTVTRLNGTPRKLVATNSTINSLKIGSTSWGKTDEIICSDCNLPSIDYSARLEKGPSDAGVNVGFTMTNGIIAMPNNTINAGFRFPPGTHCMWSGAEATETLFRVEDVTQDANNTYVRTSLTGGFPNVPLTAGKLFIQVHPAPRATFVNCTGSADAIDLSQMPAGSPLYSYSRRTHTGNSGIVDRKVWGNVSSVKINVLTTYTGVQSTCALTCVEQTVANGAQVNYQPSVNLQTAGLRTITPSGVTGQQVGDSGLTLPNVLTWLGQTFETTISPNISGEASGVWPSFTIEVVADQGIVPTAVAPLRLRLAV